ncbi:MAG: metallophosphoesterase, partial [Deltaproteobacteria bacterium]|nr:metallophosphoesterase [Deltaproteobacteria bacterium]
GAIRAKDGVFFVTGNHEYYSGLSSWLSALQRMGWRVLANEHQVIHRGGARLVIAGVNDHDSQDSSPAQALEGAPAGAPRVLLAHQPRSAFQAGGLGVDLQLSGHTHGGQFFPWKYFVRLQQPVLAGLAVVGGVRVYTHRGTGYWGPPLRLGAPPEIAVLELVCEQLVDDA